MPHILRAPQIKRRASVARTHGHSQALDDAGVGAAKERDVDGRDLPYRFAAATPAASLAVAASCRRLCRSTSANRSGSKPGKIELLSGALNSSDVFVDGRRARVRGHGAEYAQAAYLYLQTGELAVQSTLVSALFAQRSAFISQVHRRQVQRRRHKPGPLPIFGASSMRMDARKQRNGTSLNSPATFAAFS